MGLKERIEQLTAAEVRALSARVGHSQHYSYRGRTQWPGKEKIIAALMALGINDALYTAVDKIIAERGSQAIEATAITAESGAIICTKESMGAALKSEPEQVKLPLGTVDKAVRDLIEAVTPKGPALDMAEVEKIVAREIEKARIPRVTEIHVTNDTTATTVKVGLAHKQFAELLQMATARKADGRHINIQLVGPAASGKTHACEQLAKALTRPFYFNGAIDTEYKLSGFVDANGHIISAPFRRSYPQASVYLFDEVTSSMPSALLAFSGALANGQTDFPGVEEPVQRHVDQLMMAASNTFGLTGDPIYIGNGRLDGATLDRFTPLFWGYDEELERITAGEGADAIVDRVQALRKKAAQKGLKIVISPRASQDGAALVRSGMSVERALEHRIFSRLSNADRTALNA